MKGQSMITRENSKSPPFTQSGMEASDRGQPVEDEGFESPGFFRRKKVLIAIVVLAIIVGIALIGFSRHRSAASVDFISEPVLRSDINLGVDATGTINAVTTVQ